jgi:hypothetical protein
MHSMTFLTAECKENQPNLHKDHLQQDKGDMNVMTLIITGDEMWVCVSCYNIASVFTMEVRIIPQTEKSTTQHSKCEEHTHGFLRLSRWDALGVCS